MATADTNRVSLFFSPEAVWGETPASSSALKPKMYEVRMTGETLGHAKQTVASNTIRTDRMRDTLSEVAASAEGEINFELAAKDWDIMIEGVLANDTSYIYTLVVSAIASADEDTNQFKLNDADFEGFVVGAEVWVSGFTANSGNNGRFYITGKGTGYITVSGNALTDESPAGEVVFKTNAISTGDLTVGSATTVTSATFDFTDLDLEAGQYLLLGNFTNAGNNKIVKLATIAEGTLTFSNSGLTAESADSNAYIVGKRVKNGIVSKSFLLEKHFGDIDKLMHFTGMRPGSMSLNVESQQIVTGSFTFMGKEGFPADDTVSGHRVEASISDALNATTNVGSIKEGGTDLATALRSITVEIGNNLRTKPKIGSRSPIDIGYGFIDVTGTVNAYLEDLTLLNKMINHTVTSLEFRFTDAAGNAIHFTLPRLYFSSGNPTTPGGNEDVMLPLEFTAVRDQTTNAVAIVDLLQKI